MATTEPDVAIYGADDIVFEADDNQDAESLWSQSADDYDSQSDDDESTTDSCPYRNTYRHIKTNLITAHPSIAIRSGNDIVFEADSSDDEESDHASDYDEEESDDEETTGLINPPATTGQCGVAARKSKNGPGVAIYGEDDILFESNDDENNDSDAHGNDSSVEFMIQLRERRQIISADDGEESWSDSDSSSGHGSTYSVPSTADDSPFRHHHQTSDSTSCDEEDTWVGSDFSSCSSPEFHDDTKHGDRAVKDAEWRRMNINSQIAEDKYTLTEQRLRGFKWNSQFFIDGQNYLSIMHERVLDAHRFAVQSDPESHSLSTCRWHKRKTSPRKISKHGEDGDLALPEIKLTDVEGKVWFLDDLTYYRDDENDEDEDEDDEVYW
ncbi:hypothetical protein N0V88_006694 [Collariella sp. IMI 366227]|nr:hypothetical protein N0V88_006694 [Collariella sp. IMI 366227]